MLSAKKKTTRDLSDVGASDELGDPLRLRPMARVREQQRGEHRKEMAGITRRHLEMSVLHLLQSNLLAPPA
jgi:hypothetical protein